jgi:conjugal transfer pilus assembly protein TraB
MNNFTVFKNRQWYVLGGLVACLLVGCVIFWAISTRDTPVKSQQSLKSSLVTGASRTNPQEAWVYQFRNDAELVKKRLTALEEMLTKLLKFNEAGKEEKPPTVPQEEPIENVRQVLKTHQDSEEVIPGSSADGQVLPPPPQSSPTDQNEMPTTITAKNSFRSKAVRKISLSLKNARSSKPLKSVDNTIPAGAFARAILLGGVDASASIQASSDPRPALLRLTDAGTLPRKFRSDLKGCHALAACYGDISSERVFMRLEKLTCTERKTGEIIEVKVQGYVAGEDGRTGVRGTVVDRAGESMRNAMMGGFISGVGDFLSKSHNAVTFSPIAGLAQTNPMGMGEMLKHGAGKGVNSALDKYADFYIKRAEQVQPVIQVGAGRQVDIVFTEGVSIGDSVYRQVLGHSNDQERYHQIQAVNETPQKSVGEWTSALGTDTSATNNQIK